MLTITTDSHLDHALTDSQIDYILKRFSDRNGFFIETFELPEGLGKVPCGLYGPIVGDAPVMIGTFDEKRGDRPYTSRMVRLPPRETRTVTVIAGPHENHTCLLFTAYGGPLAPKEPGEIRAMLELACADHHAGIAAQLARSEEFWAEHALARPE